MSALWPVVILALSTADPAPLERPEDAIEFGELVVGLRLDAYTNFENYASGLMGLDIQYSRDFYAAALPSEITVELRWGLRFGMLFDGMYNVESKMMQPRFYPVYLPLEPLLMLDLRVWEGLSWRLGAALGMNIIAYPHNVASVSLMVHATTGLAYRLTDHWGLVLGVGWGGLGKWDLWDGPQFSLGAFYW
jgi:hypothetical protein